MGAHRPVSAGREINHAIYDPRNGRIWAAANDCLVRLRNRLAPPTWARPGDAKQHPLKFPETSGVKLERIWHIEPGRASEPEVLYAGVAPAALFRSDDGGQTLERRRPV